MKSTGYCVVTVVENRVKVLDSGVIPTKAKQSHGERLHVIHDAITVIETLYSPLNKTIVRERGFSRFNKSTQALYKTHGTIEEALHSYTFLEYSPMTVKSVLTGNGKSSKESVADCVQRWLTEPREFKTDDESDAIAVAVTHLITTGELQEVLNAGYEA